LVNIGDVRRNNYFCSVKKQIKIISTVFVSILYCYAISFYIVNCAVFSEAETKKNDCIIFSENPISDQFWHTNQNKNLVSSQHQNSPSPVKYSFKLFFTKPFSNNKLICLQDIPFVYYAQKAFIVYKSTDIIFPFHYFW
jgi:hypothetical protein